MWGRVFIQLRTGTIETQHFYKLRCRDFLAEDVWYKDYEDNFCDWIDIFVVCYYVTVHLLFRGNCKVLVV